MQKEKKLILQIKGYGDFIILCHALRLRKSNDDITILISTRFLDLANYLIPEVRLSTVKFNYVASFYNLKKASILQLIKDGLIINKKINAMKFKNNYVDRVKIRDLFVYLGSNIKSISKYYNIYTSYELFFNIKFTREIFKAKYKKVIVYPIGSNAIKSMNFMDLKLLIHTLESKKINFEILAHEDDDIGQYKNLPNKFTLYKNSGGLINKIKNCSDVISTDTSCLHLAYFYQKNTYLFGNYDPNFVPLNFNHKNYLMSYKDFKNMI